MTGAPGTQLRGSMSNRLNVWFHGYGTDTGWDVYNWTVRMLVYTHDIPILAISDASGTWNYYNGTVWKPTSGLGVVPV